MCVYVCVSNLPNPFSVAHMYMFRQTLCDSIIFLGKSALEKADSLSTHLLPIALH